ncbi:MAG: class I SAM-dependent methyltransferase [Pyrinomonadaceae bacterium]
MTLHHADSALIETETNTTAHHEAVPLAHEAVHDTAAMIFRDIPRGKVLDVPAGYGALAARLREMSFDVRCCDLYTEIFRVPGIEIRRGDLSASLPYEDAEFDHVACLEGLEHIENPQQAIREFRRVLRTGGHLVVSIPNILNIEERIKWLLYGYTSHFKPLSRAHLAGLRGGEFGAMEEVVRHVNPIAYTELRYTLEENGFELLKLYRDKPKGHLWAYWPVTALIRLLARFTSERKRRERWSTELQSNEILLGGNTLIFHAILKTKETAR